DWIFASPRARHLARREGAALSNMRPTGPRGMIVERDVRAYLAERDAPAPAPRLTPVARRMAAEHALDPAELPASDGIVRRADVEAALSAREPAAAPGVRRVPLSALRRAIQRRLEANARAAVPVTLTRLVDATELVALRERLLPRFEGGARPTYTDFLILIAARALREHGALNGTFDGEALTLYDDVHMGLAVDTARGLVVPVLRSAEALGLAECAARRADLVARAQADALAPHELSGGSFTLTNLGALGVDAFTPVLNPPQIAILGVGRIVSAPSAYRGGVALREQMHLSLTFDHRATDGAPAARLLASIAERIEHPELVWV
ncbi:MAG: dihydrolipoamide acetyltransferase family protein, partial [Hyphomicrobiales bacterium]|nr:dihydrolipoamide acetyltransferase family protein [Hyphomicrobiales bacterium]